MKHFTDGPWQWFAHANGDVYLATPDRGHLLVMDFARKGMQGGQPRFAEWHGDHRERWGGTMVPADRMNILDHPDARLIAAAPDLVRALLHALEDFQCSQKSDGPHPDCICRYCDGWKALQFAGVTAREVRDLSVDRPSGPAVP